tara:strand:+ start:272 stop:493 length:222 start_codon:yes stop_codon:yes gene_type:complete
MVGQREACGRRVVVGWMAVRVGRGCGAGCPLVETGKAGPVLILVRHKPAHSGVAFESGTKGKAATGNVVKKGR